MMERRPGYAYIWEYVVRPERIEDFEEAYGPEGAWVRLFRQVGGYIRTELHRDRSSPERFVTIDHWESSFAWEAFRSEFSQEFEELDARCEELTASEREIGRFDSVP